jgi:hypothetical protein
MTITPTESGGFWVKFREGRSRFFAAGSDMALKLQAGQAFEKIEESRRAFAAGTHEPVVYFRNEDGKIGVPPDPSMIPAGCVRYEANNLAEIDRISAEMDRDHYNDFQDDGRFTAGMDDWLGGPRQYLVDRLQQGNLTNKHRDVIHAMIRDADYEAGQRQKITTRTAFHFRDHDR